jgi:hypothetical protein
MSMANGEPADNRNAERVVARTPKTQRTSLSTCHKRTQRERPTSPSRRVQLHVRGAGKPATWFCFWKRCNCRIRMAIKPLILRTAALRLKRPVEILWRLVSLGDPVSHTSSVSRAAAPRALAGRAKQSARSRCVLVLYRDGRANEPRALHVTSEPHKVWVRHDSIRNVDRKIVGRVARPRLGYERQIPRSVECCG